MKAIRFLAVVLLGAAALAACESTVSRPQFPSLTYAHMPTLRFNLADVATASEFAAPLAAPHIEHAMPEAPEKAMRQWAEDRLAAGGSSGRIVFTIIDASVVEAELPVDSGISGAFKEQQAERYTGTAEARLEVIDTQGTRRGFASAKVSLSRTVPEGITLNERDQALFTLTEDLMKRFDAEMEKNIREFLGGYLL